jgi:hypothetical protein
LYASPNVIRVIKSRSMRWAGHAARMGEMRNAHSSLVGKASGVDLGEIGREGVDWVHMAQDKGQWRAVLNTVMNLRVP